MAGGDWGLSLRTWRLLREIAISGIESFSSSANDGSTLSGKIANRFLPCESSSSTRLRNLSTPSAPKEDTASETPHISSCDGSGVSVVKVLFELWEKLLKVNKTALTSTRGIASMQLIPSQLPWVDDDQLVRWFSGWDRQDSWAA